MTRDYAAYMLILTNAMVEMNTQKVPLRILLIRVNLFISKPIFTHACAHYKKGVGVCGKSPGKIEDIS